MIRNFNYSTRFGIIVLAIILIYGCGGDNQAPDEKESNKTSASDLFKDDRAAYDAKAIDPAAEVISITLSAIGTSMSDMSYDQKAITVKAGTTIKLKLINTFMDAAMPHNWVLVHFGTMEAVAKAGVAAGKEGEFVPATNDVLIATKLLGPKEETEITFPAPPKGKYQFVCTYPGHWTLMNGDFVVE